MKYDLSLVGLTAAELDKVLAVIRNEVGDHLFQMYAPEIHPRP